MIPKAVVFHALPEPYRLVALTPGPHFSVVMDYFLCESSGLPPFHPRSKLGHVINAAFLQRHISADVLEAPSPEQLASARHVLHAGKTIVVHLPRAFLEGRPYQPQGRVVRELLEQIGKITFVE